ncbi:MAG: AAA family ATPase [Bacteroidales bacterium]|jgi:DNA repair exonuclease SbcCD ATPase subunit|nr:AAA family ATPase [Bacteroidales bacterium]
MKRVDVEEMSLVNFKGIKNLTIKFNKSETEIRGANATGKTTIADAFNWLLFGKDTVGNGDAKFGIKTNDVRGNVIPKIDHEVTATLSISGQLVALRRVLSEDWVTPRGKAEPELRGNSTSYFYNGVPLKEGEYKSKINAIIGEDLFRLITNPLYFPKLKWEDQRAILLNIAGDVSLGTIAAGRSEFSALLEQLSGKSLAEYKAEISARKKKLKEALDLIPARIDEVMRATPAEPDYKALESEKNNAENSIRDIEAAMQNAAEASRQEYEAQRKIQSEINVLRTKQQQLLFDSTKKAKETWNNTNSHSNDVRNRFYSLRRESESTSQMRQREMDSFSSELKRIESRLNIITKEIENKRSDWFSESAKEYSPSDSEFCPNCGYDLHQQKNEESKEKFEKTKFSKLDRITEEGKQLSQEKSKIEKGFEEIKKSYEALKLNYEEESEDFDLKLSKLQEEISANPQVSYIDPKPSEIPEYEDLEAKIIELSKSLQNRRKNEIFGQNNPDLTTQKRELQKNIDEIKKQLALKSVIENNAKRKAQLLMEEKDLAQQKADLEGQEFTADSLVKEQMNEVERRVNQKFSLVRFKMFTQQINGGEKPDCVMYSATDGSRYIDMNNAQKINVGLDIINTLCDFNGVYAPIFIDNAEGINQLLSVDSQLIKLIVTTDKELIIK